MIVILRTIVWLAFLIISSALSASVFTVNEQIDAPDTNPGNGICDSSNSIGFQCTLRAAVMEANALPGADTIVLTQAQLPYTLTIPAAGSDDDATGDLNISESVSILGFDGKAAPLPTLRPTIVADNNARIFQVEADNVSIVSLRLTGGFADNSGGAIRIDNSESVVVDAVEIFENTSTFGGGGIALFGSSAAMSFMDIHTNQSAGSGGAIMVSLSSDLTLTQSSVRSNLDTSVATPAAIRSVTSSDLALFNTTVSGNSGTGILASSTLQARNVTVLGNTGEQIEFSGSTGSTLFLRNVVVIGGCIVTGSPAGTISTNGHNFADSNGCEIELGSSNVIAADPELGPLEHQANEFSSYHIPQPGSPLIDNGHPVIGGIGCIEQDQRDTSRPIDGDGNGNDRCDIGSIEAPEPPPADSIFSDRFQVIFGPIR